MGNAAGPLMAAHLNCTGRCSARKMGSRFLMLSSDTRAIGLLVDVVWYDLNGARERGRGRYYLIVII